VGRNPSRGNAHDLSWVTYVGEASYAGTT
jgi:hypothetical protein